LRAGAGEYAGAASNFAFALRNSITGIQFPAATSDFSDSINDLNPSRVRIENPWDFRDEAIAEKQQDEAIQK
ncbi:unnamed protein product, partial [marine sediment metagenome]